MKTVAGDAAAVRLMLAAMQDDPELRDLPPAIVLCLTEKVRDLLSERLTAEARPP